jgi:hypothetical protein
MDSLMGNVLLGDDLHHPKLNYVVREKKAAKAAAALLRFGHPTRLVIPRQASVKGC